MSSKNLKRKRKNAKSTKNTRSSKKIKLSKDLIELEDFDPTKLSIGKLNKDDYGNLKADILYNGQKNQKIVVKYGMYTFGVQSIKEFNNENVETGNYQMALSPYSNGVVDKDNKDEVLFSKFCSGLEKCVSKFLFKNAKKCGVNTKAFKTEELCATLVKPILYRKKKGDEVLVGSDAKTYYYAKLLSRIPRIKDEKTGKMVKDISKISPENILTFFNDAEGNEINPVDLVGARGFVYPDIVLNCIYIKSSKVYIKTAINECNFIIRSRERRGRKVDFIQKEEAVKKLDQIKDNDDDSDDDDEEENEEEEEE